MLCCSVSCRPVLCCVVLCRAVSRCVVVCGAVLCCVANYVVFYRVVLCWFVSCRWLCNVLWLFVFMV